MRAAATHLSAEML